MTNDTAFNEGDQHPPKQSRQQKTDEGRKESDENTNAAIEEKGKDRQYTLPPKEKERKKSIL